VPRNIEILIYGERVTDSTVLRMRQRELGKINMKYTRRSKYAKEIE
jgi:hypothetical protein